MKLSRMLKKWFRNADKGLLTLLLMFIICTTIFLTPWLAGNDRIGYYVFPRTLVIDGDLNIQDEFEHFQENLQNSQALQLDTKTGKYYTMFPIGTGFVWMPFFFIGHSLTYISGGVLDGYSEMYLWWVSFGSALFGFLGILLIYSMLKNYFSEFVSTLSVVAIWFSTNLFYYMFFEPLMSHAISMAFVTLFIYFWHRSLRRRKTIDWILLGVVGGIMFIVRFQNAIFFLLPLIDVIPQYLGSIKRKHIKFPWELLKDNLLFLVGIFIGFLPQMIYFMYAHNYMFTFWKHYNGGNLNLIRGLSNIHNVLFSTNHGLITWTPIILLSVIGIFYFIKYYDNKLGAKLSVLFLIQLLIVASFTQWHAGQSFGHRMFVLFSLLFALGLGALFEHLIIWLKSKDINYKAVLIIIVLLFTAWNFGLMMQYGTRMIPTEGAVSIKEVFYNNIFVIPEKALGIAKEFLFNRTKFIS
jgi:hypothetical protein